MLTISLYKIGLLLIATIIFTLLNLMLYFAFTAKRKNYYISTLVIFISFLLTVFQVVVDTYQPFMIISVLILSLAIQLMQTSDIKALSINLIISVLGLLVILVAPLNLVYLLVLLLLVGSIFNFNRQAKNEYTLLKNSQITVTILLSITLLLEVFINNEAIAFLQTVFTFFMALIYLMLSVDRVNYLFKAASITSITDPLTKVFNKRYFLKKIDAMSEKDDFSVIFSDIDNFKRLNDTKGHEEGDRILILTAQLMKKVIGNKGFVARYGGEEIVAIVPGEDAVLAYKLAEKFRQEVEKIGVTVSVGVATGNGHYVVKEADDLMYFAKKNGKNRVINKALLPTKE